MHAQSKPEAPGTALYCLFTTSQIHTSSVALAIAKLAIPLLQMVNLEALDVAHFAKPPAQAPNISHTLLLLKHNWPA